MSSNPVTTIQNSMNVNQTSNAQQSSNTTLGKDAFLKILVTQLKNQDPTKPMSDQQFIAQMAQFSSVEQLTNMSASISKLSEMLGANTSIIGKEVFWSQADSSGTSHVYSGTVDSISFDSGKQVLGVNGQSVTMGQVLRIQIPGSPS